MPSKALKGFYEFLGRRQCLRCGKFGVEIAHIRAFPSRKTAQLLPRRLDVGQYAAIPLCPDCHRHAPDSIHNIGEAAFFEALGKTPCYVFQYLAMSLAEFSIRSRPS